MSKLVAAILTLLFSIVCMGIVIWSHRGDYIATGICWLSCIAGVYCGLRWKGVI